MLDDHTPLPALGMPAQANSALRRAGVFTVGDLKNQTVNSLRALPGVGEATVDAVREAFARHDLPLKVGRRQKKREKDIEASVCDYARSLGYWPLKFESPGTIGVPDRLFFRDGRVVLVEFKRPGEKPRDSQVKNHAKFAQYGFTVHVIDSVPAGKQLFDELELGLD